MRVEARRYFIGFSQTHLEHEPRWTRKSGEILVKSRWWSPRISHLDWPEVLVFIWPLTRIMKSLVEDKEARINEVMKMMGMPADARWMWNPVEPMVPEKKSRIFWWFGIGTCGKCGKWNLDIQRFSDDPFHMIRLHNTSPFNGVTRYHTRAFNGPCSSSMTIKDGDGDVFGVHSFDLFSPTDVRNWPFSGLAASCSGNFSTCLARLSHYRIQLSWNLLDKKPS